MKIPRAAVVAVLALSLVGCAQEAPPEVAAPAPVETPAETPTATPTPEPTKPALGDLVLTTEGLGSLVVGFPIPNEPADLAIVAWDATGCGGVEGEPWAGAWASTYPGESFIIDSTAGGVEQGNLQVVWTPFPGIHTDAGLQVGDSLADLKAAYASFDGKFRPYQTDLYVITGDEGSLVYEIADGAIFAISAVAADVDPPSNFASDAGSPCA